MNKQILLDTLLFGSSSLLLYSAAMFLRSPEFKGLIKLIKEEKTNSQEFKLTILTESEQTSDDAQPIATETYEFELQAVATSLRNDLFSNFNLGNLMVNTSSTRDQDSSNWYSGNSSSNHREYPVNLAAC